MINISYINDYYRELNDLKTVVGAINENSIRQAFQNLLSAVGQEYNLILFPEYQFTGTKGNALRADGVLMDRLRLVHGWWEAKDEKDDLERELEIKLAKGYPSDNIIFEDTRTAVLLQNGQQVLRCELSNAKQLQKLLDSFFNYELPQVQQFNQARNKFITELPKVSSALKELLIMAQRDNLPFKHQAAQFLQMCKNSIGKQVTEHHVNEMLIQHILTDEIFRAIFPNSRFHINNHLAYAINNLVHQFFRGETQHNLLRRLEPYFAAIRQTAAATITSYEKQEFLKQIYADFYTAYNPKDADKLGIVYTPQEVVRFIIEGCDWLSQIHFNKRLDDNSIDILDPCMGTGTFIIDLLEYWRGDKRAIMRKFATEVHANEISILPYYIACLNIEHCYYEITGQWKEFNGACFINTLHNWGFEQSYVGAQSDLFGDITEENKARVRNQNQRKIPIIIGNPPYNATQKNANDNNPNDSAPDVDKRIKNTYVDASTAQNLTKLYDPYIRFFRWASDRLGNQGILGFITNRSYLDSRQADGFRKIIAKEFQEIWIVDLMSDVRKNPKISGTKHNIFGIQTGVAIAFLVKIQELNTDDKFNNCTIHYLNLDDFITAINKRRWLRVNNLRALAKAGEFMRISPNVRSEWLNQPYEDWSEWLPVASKETKTGNNENAIFKLYSLGITTARDEWIYGYSRDNISKKAQYFIEFYQAELQRWNKLENKIEQSIEAFVQRNIKWTTELTSHLVKGTKLKYHADRIVSSLYRPFVSIFLYYDKIIVHRTYQQTKIFPIEGKSKNLAIGISGTPHSKPFQSLVVALIPCLDLLEKTQFLPLWIYDKNGNHLDNITDWALTQFHTYYNDTTINKLDIFHYVYAVLHDPKYRKKYALNLKTEFPRIPFHSNFFAWANIGAQLVTLHAYFEQVEPYPLERVEVKSGIIKVKLKADKIKHCIEIDSHTTLMNIPAQAWQYQLGNRSALEWVLDQYKEKTPTDATIQEKFNTYRFADYKEQVIELLGKVCRVSVETMKLIQAIESVPTLERGNDHYGNNLI